MPKPFVRSMKYRRISLEREGSDEKRGEDASWWLAVRNADTDELGEMERFDSKERGNMHDILDFQEKMLDDAEDAWEMLERVEVKCL